MPETLDSIGTKVDMVVTKVDEHVRENREDHTAFRTAIARNRERLVSVEGAAAGWKKLVWVAGIGLAGLVFNFVWDNAVQRDDAKLLQAIESLGEAIKDANQ